MACCRGLPKVDWLFVFASAAFNVIRVSKLLPRIALRATCLRRAGDEPRTADSDLLEDES